MVRKADAIPLTGAAPMIVVDRMTGEDRKPGDRVVLTARVDPVAKETGSSLLLAVREMIGHCLPRVTIKTNPQSARPEFPSPGLGPPSPHPMGRGRGVARATTVIEA